MKREVCTWIRYRFESSAFDGRVDDPDRECSWTWWTNSFLWWTARHKGTFLDAHRERRHGTRRMDSRARHDVR